MGGFRRRRASERTLTELKESDRGELEPFDFPELSDEAVVAIDTFLEEFYDRFQNHYFAQMHRYYHDRPDPDPGQLRLPLPDLPF